MIPELSTKQFTEQWASNFKVKYLALTQKNTGQYRGGPPLLILIGDFTMSKIDKKKERLVEQIAQSEAELSAALFKKKSGVSEVSVPKLTERIKKMKAELAGLK